MYAYLIYNKGCCPFVGLICSFVLFLPLLLTSRRGGVAIYETCRHIFCKFPAKVLHLFLKNK